MAEMYKTACSSSPSPPEPDDFSLFLHQMLLRSSSSPASAYSLVGHSNTAMQSASPHLSLPENPQLPIQPSLLSGSERPVDERISATETSSGLNPPCGVVFPSSLGYFPVSATNVSSSSVGGTINNDPDEYDCDSEEGFEVLIEEVTEKPVPPRQSKRSRAAEVHNLSEKRRRSRINEKMKALQNLIPNSNKTDKASMLDEAIEYLKQLQLQVQMLTMRNGLSSYPLCLPRELNSAQLSQIKMGFYGGNGSLNLDMTGMIPVNQETPATTLFNVPNQSTATAQLPGADLSSIMNSENALAVGSSFQGQLRPLQLNTISRVKETMPCKKLHGGDLSYLSKEQLNANDHCHPHSLDFETGAEATASIPFAAQEPHIKDSALAAHVLPESGFPSDLQCDSILAPHLNGAEAGRTTSEGHMNTERLNF